MAIFPKTDEKASTNRTLAGPRALLLGAALGLIVGGAGVLAFMRTPPKAGNDLPPSVGAPSETVVSPQFESSPTVMLAPPRPNWMTRALKSPFTTPSAPASSTQHPAPNTQNQTSAGPPPQIEPPPSMPGGIISGGVSPGSMSLAPVKPPPPPVSMDVQLVKLDVYDANPVLGAGAVEGYAKSLGATVRRLSDFKDSDAREADALLILISDDKLNQLVSYVKGKQPNVLDSFWKGNADTRQSRLYDEPQRQLDAMERKRKELLMKFLEDATPVKIVDEAIDKLKSTLGRLKIDSKLEKLAAVKVTYRPKN